MRLPSVRVRRTRTLPPTRAGTLYLVYCVALTVALPACCHVVPPSTEVSTSITASSSDVPCVLVQRQA